MSSSKSMPNEIRMVSLKELGHWSGGGTPSKAKPAYWENGTIPWVSPKDMKVAQITKTEDYITEAAVRESTTNLVPAGSLLMVTRSGILRHTFPVAIASVPVTVNQDLKALIPKPGILSKYVAFALNSFSQDILHGCSKQGTTVNSIDTEKLLRFKIPVVSPVNQERIVAEIEKQFSRLDEAVASLMRIQANLKRYKASVLKAAVEGKLTEQWRKDHPNIEPADQLLKRILTERRTKWEAEELAKMKAKGTKPKDDSWKKKYKEPAGPDTANLSELPEGWVWSTLGQCFYVAVGATPSRKESSYWNGDIPWVSSGEVQFSRVLGTREHITKEGLKNSSTQVNPAGSVLLGMIGEVKTRGQAAILEIPAANNQNCAAIWVSETPIKPEYIYYWLVQTYEETRRIGSGNNQQALNKAIIEMMPFPLSPISELNKVIEEIDCRLSVTEKLEITIKTNLTRAERLRQTILQQVFSGGFQ